MTIAWTARLIAADEEFEGAPILRGEFPLDTGHGDVTRALLHATARGIFTASVNGVPVDDDVLSPGWTSYEWRLRYRTYDVTQLLPTVGGRVVLGLELGNGWYRGRLGWTGRREVYGPELGGLAQLEVEFADGHRQIVGTDTTWTAGPSATVANDLYDGQTIDARRVDNSWQVPGFHSGHWSGTHQLELDEAILTAYIGPPVRRQQEIAAQRVWQSPSGKTLIDFGQNLVGWMRFEVAGAEGTTITIRYAEVLENDELGTRPLRSALATDRFILSGGSDRFEPTKTFHGFRYAQIEGWPGEVSLDSLTAVVVHSGFSRIGEFSCSDDMLNQLHSNVVWGARGNFVDVPTDCPQRDERLGWTGDISVFAPTAAFLFDVKDFLRDWQADLMAEQQAAEGRVAFVVPDVLKLLDNPFDEGWPTESTAIWSDAAVWVPWALWQAYGDQQVLADSIDSMLAHLRRVESLLSDTGLWDKGFQFGDWLDPAAPPEDPAAAKADPGVVATACLYRSARIAAEAAAILGRCEDADYLQHLADRTKVAFNTHYVTDGGLVRSDSPTVYTLAIHFGLLEPAAQAVAGDRLAALVAENGYRIATGFAGTPYIADALTATGHLDDAYRLLLERECPSWLYSVGMGATTIWERWDSMLPDGSINPGEMTSFNHYALGAVADWMHRTIGGLAPAAPGYRKILVRPRPGGGLTHAATSLLTPHGRVAVHWHRDGRDLTVAVTVPEGATAIIDLPNSDCIEVGAGEHTVTVDHRPADEDTKTPVG
jgi:alpha-L-rhamnosidase